MWDAWTASRNENTELIDTIPPLLEITTEKLQFWMTRFVLETREQQFEEQEKMGDPPLTLMGMMEHLFTMQAQTMTFCFFLLARKVVPVQGVKKIVW